MFWPKIYRFPPHILESHLSLCKLWGVISYRALLWWHSMFIYCSNVLMFRECSFAKLTPNCSSIWSDADWWSLHPCFLSLCRLTSGSYLLCRKIYRLQLLLWPCSQNCARAKFYPLNKLKINNLQKGPQFTVGLNLRISSYFLCLLLSFVPGSMGNLWRGKG